MENGLMVLHSNRLEALTEVVTDWLSRHPLAPLEEETVLVQSNGMAQWLKLELASACDISAGLRFQMPIRFLWSAYRTVLGEERVPRTSPFDKTRLLWRLYRLLPALLDQDAFYPLRHFLDDDNDSRKRHQLAERLADLYDAYQVYRADWLADWQAGNDWLRHAADNANHEPLPESQQWQAHLWRALLADLPAEHRELSRSTIHTAFLQALANDPRPAGLPRRIVIFGISALPQQALDALGALSRHCQILMLVQNPCQHYWADIVEDRQLLRRQLEQRKRHRVMVPDNSVHPLLAAWGKQGRDFIGLLYAHDDPEQYQHAFNNIDIFLPHNNESLLGQLQQDILDLTPLPEATQRPVAQPDTSLAFTLAHGAQREVEILQDTLLAKFSNDPCLQPRDVIVMVPDIETYAPHIEAVFGGLTPGDPRHLPYTLSDRSASNASPLAQAVERLLNLPQWRFTTADILDLLEVPALRERFAIPESALGQLARWVDQARIRWGLHGPQRASLGLPDFAQNSWGFGLERMLTGYLMGDGPAWQGIQPLDEVAGLNAGLAGRLDHLLERLGHHWQAFQHDATAADWQQRFSALLDDLFLPVTSEDQALDANLRDALSDWLTACEQADCNDILPLTVARRPLLDALNAESLSQRFMAGRINFCTLMPMRAIPFRHVCLLGMTEGDYPRQQQPMDFDLMRQWGRYRPGDRSRREDDRYLFLEALLSARESLSISWVGRNLQDNSERPPSVLVAQLRDHINQRWTTQDREDTEGTSLADQLTTEHPLQPFSERYFFDKGERTPPLTTYAHQWEALYQSQPVSSHTTLPAMAQDEPVHCTSLARFLKKPVAHFFRERLKAQLDQSPDSLDDTEPFTLTGLEKWQVQDQLLTSAQRAGKDHYPQAMADTLTELDQQGALPRAPFTEATRDGLSDPLLPSLTHYFAWQDHYPAALPQQEISLTLNDLQIEDWLTELRGSMANPQRLVLLNGMLEERWDKLSLHWCLHLAANAAGLSLTTRIIAQDGTATLAPLSASQAHDTLANLAKGWQQGLCQPLPVASATAFAWLQGEANDKSEHLARKAFESHYNQGEVDKDAALKRAWPDFDQLMAATESHQSGFVYWTEQLYRPLYQAIKWEAHP